MEVFRFYNLKIESGGGLYVNLPSPNGRGEGGEVLRERQASFFCAPIWKGRNNDVII
jgi:hypothetical protein